MLLRIARRLLPRLASCRSITHDCWRTDIVHARDVGVRGSTSPLSAEGGCRDLAKYPLGRAQLETKFRRPPRVLAAMLRGKDSVGTGERKRGAGSCCAPRVRRIKVQLIRRKEGERSGWVRRMLDVGAHKNWPTDPIAQ